MRRRSVTINSIDMNYTFRVFTTDPNEMTHEFYSLLETYQYTNTYQSVTVNYGMASLFISSTAPYVEMDTIQNLLKKSALIHASLRYLHVIHIYTYGYHVSQSEIKI
jgi:hypothetical protein